MPMKHYVMKFDLGTGKIRRLEEFKTIDGAFLRYHELIDEYVGDPHVSIKMLEAQDRVSLIKNFGSFFHNCPHHEKHRVKLNYKCPEDLSGGGDQGTMMYVIPDEEVHPVTRKFNHRRSVGCNTDVVMDEDGQVGFELVTDTEYVEPEEQSKHKKTK